MIDVDLKTLQLRQLGVTQGVRPVIIKVIRGEYLYKGNYVVSIGDEFIYFNHLNFRYNYKEKRAVDFKISYDSLEGYRFSFEKTCYKRITLIFKDGLEFCFKFMCDCEEAGHNEKNAIEFMKKLKEMNVFQRNNLKGGKREQRTISKADQLFVKEVRSPSKKRGFFG
jgi:hypothetical protein